MGRVLYGGRGLTLTEGSGGRVRDSLGREYLDWFSGHGALLFGHRHPRLVAAATDEERAGLRTPFLRDVKKHVDAIAAKYIRPDEGTLPFALMYIPAENVYYETIIKDDDFGGEGQLLSYALQRRVVPVSPNSFYAYLQTILLGLKGLRVEESARAVLDNLDRLNGEFQKFAESFALVGRQMENARKNFEDAEKRLGKVSGKLGDLDGLVKGLETRADGPRLEAG